MGEAPTSLLSDELLAQLSAHGDLRQFGRGEGLITEGELSDALYILVSGELKVFTRDDRGRELVYNILKPGEFFGEMFLDGGRRSASVKATVPSRCVVIDHAEVRGFMRSYPEFAECLALKLIERLRHATQQIRALAMDGVYERAVELINALAIEEDGVRMIPPHLTQQEIANRVGATREMVNHILRDLQRGGFLTRAEGKRLLITRELPKHW